MAHQATISIFCLNNALVDVGHVRGGTTRSSEVPILVHDPVEPLECHGSIINQQSQHDVAALEPGTMVRCRQQVGEAVDAVVVGENDVVWDWSLRSASVEDDVVVGADEHSGVVERGKGTFEATMTAVGVTSDPEQPTVELLEDVSTETLDQWRDLAIAGGAFFQTPDWVLSWWEHLAGEPRTSVATWRDGAGELIAVAFMSHTRERVHPRVHLTLPVVVNAGSGIGAGDHLGFPGAGQRLEQIRSWIGSFDGTVRLQNLDRDHAALAEGWRLISQTSTYERSVTGAEPIVTSLKMARDVRRSRRRLDAQDVHIEVMQGDCVTTDVVAALFRHHADRFESRGIRSFFGPERQPQLDALVRSASDRCGPLAVIARHHDEIVGVNWSFRCGTRLHYYQSGWSQTYRAESLGTVLIVEAMTWAQQHDLETYDFLRGSDQYKDRFGARHRLDHTYELRRGVAGVGFAAKSVVSSRMNGRRTDA